MTIIPISKIKQIREDLGLSHIIIFGMKENISNYVATHGKTSLQAQEAADYGNKLKKLLGWPLQMCNSKPIERICKNCSYLKYPSSRGATYGEGYKCLVEPVPVHRHPDDRACRHFEPNK